MRLDAALHKDSSDRRLPPGILVRERARAGRPRERFRIRIRDRCDVARARDAGIPLHLVTPNDVASFGHAMTFPPFLVVARRFAGLVDTPFRIHVLESEEGALHPRVEDLVITMLKVDPFAARAVALGNPEFLDPVHLLRRVSAGTGRTGGNARPAPEESHRAFPRWARRCRSGVCGPRTARGRRWGFYEAGTRRRPRRHSPEEPGPLRHRGRSGRASLLPLRVAGCRRARHDPEITNGPPNSSTRIPAWSPSRTRAMRWPGVTSCRRAP